jgi:hypothetical protein
MQTSTRSIAASLKDLGRLQEKLDRLLNESEAVKAGSLHDEHFMELYSNSERLDDLRMSLRNLHEQLWECSSIARGLED